MSFNAKHAVYADNKVSENLSLQPQEAYFRIWIPLVSSDTMAQPPASMQPVSETVNIRKENRYRTLSTGTSYGFLGGVKPT